ncbi:WD40-repeat-containing domain protein [Chiua virens]|nr:WD40-repeat-containing domain protein [Chiua virens]
MFRRFLGMPMMSSDRGGSTSHDAEQAKGESVEDQETRKGLKTTQKFDGRGTIYSVAFLMEGKHILSGGLEGKIRRWQLEDAVEVGTPMDAGDLGHVNNIAVSKDEKWIVGGSTHGYVSVWSVESHERMGEMKGHTRRVGAVDISQDGTKIASGSDDKTVCVWLRRTSERLLTLQHDNDVVSVKFSPDGCLLATATWNHNSVRVYDSKDGPLLVEFPIKVGSLFNQCLAWDHQTHLYIISYDGKIHYLDVSTGETLSQWPIRTDGARKHGCIALPNNRRFIAVSDDSMLSFWDTTTRTDLIGYKIHYDDTIWSMAISENYDIVLSRGSLGNTIVVRNLGDILPPQYLHNDNMDSEKESCPLVYRISSESFH